jgi:hypothetical protein
MSKQPLAGWVIGISVSASPNLAQHGFELGDAVVEIGQHLLAAGARIVHAGDLRKLGFTELLSNLAAKYTSDNPEWSAPPAFLNPLPWPVHMALPHEVIDRHRHRLPSATEVLCLDRNGLSIGSTARAELKPRQPNEADWTDGLTQMRMKLAANCGAQILLGGQVEHYKGVMPGIAEEAMLSIKFGHPLFLVGGFGGCARDIAESLGLCEPGGSGRQVQWQGRDEFKRLHHDDLKNGLSLEDNRRLANSGNPNDIAKIVLGGLSRTRPHVFVKTAEQLLSGWQADGARFAAASS